MDRRKVFGATFVILAIVLTCFIYVPVRAEDGGQFKVQLIAGKHIGVGYVYVTVEDGFLNVTYVTNGTWALAETHLAVVTDPDDFPTTKNGNPKVGKFPYKHENLGDVTKDVYLIPMDQFGSASCLYIAAQAVVVQQNGAMETAWAEGKRFTEQGNWATYFYYPLEEIVLE